MEPEGLYRLLLETYGPQHWWPARTPYEMMVGAILTQNTAWVNVRRAIANFDGRLSPAFVLDAPCGQLEEIIRPSGFFRQKAVRLKTLTRWFAGYGCDIAAVRAQDAGALRAELLALCGVGRETADSILLYAALKPVFVIDAYTRRVFVRLGAAVPEGYEPFRALMEQKLPPDVPLYNEFHALLVRHAASVCRKRPDCAACAVRPFCARTGVEDGQ